MTKVYCNKCNKEFPSMDCLNGNEKAELKEVGDFVCSDCINKEMEEQDNFIYCLECGKNFNCETDLWLCQKCMKKFDTNKLWKMHDNNELDALDFNESEKMREKFRK